MVEDEQVRSKAVREVVVYAGLLSAQEVGHVVMLRVSWLCAPKAAQELLVLGCWGSGTERADVAPPYPYAGTNADHSEFLHHNAN